MKTFPIGVCSGGGRRKNTFATIATETRENGVARNVGATSLRASFRLRVGGKYSLDEFVLSVVRIRVAAHATDGMGQNISPRKNGRKQILNENAKIASPEGAASAEKARQSLNLGKTHGCRETQGAFATIVRGNDVRNVIKRSASETSVWLRGNWTTLMLAPVSAKNALVLVRSGVCGHATRMLAKNGCQSKNSLCPQLRMLGLCAAQETAFATHVY